MVSWSCGLACLPKSDVLFIPAFVSVSDFVLAPPILVPRLDTSVDSILLLCEGMSYFS